MLLRSPFNGIYETNVNLVILTFDSFGYEICILYLHLLNPPLNAGSIFNIKLKQYDVNRCWFNCNTENELNEPWAIKVLVRPPSAHSLQEYLQSTIRLIKRKVNWLYHCPICEFRLSVLSRNLKILLSMSILISPVNSNMSSILISAVNSNMSIWHSTQLKQFSSICDTLLSFLRKLQIVRKKLNLCRNHQTGGRFE